MFLQQPLKHSVDKMILLLCVTLIVLARVQAIEEKCDGMTINGVTHVKEVLKTDLDSPYQFTIDFNTNRLFFSYSVHKKDERFQLAYINLDKKEFNVVPGIKDGFTSAVDLMNKKIYLGAKGGIYEFNLKTKQTNLLESTSQNIWQMFYKDGLYYTTYPKEEAFIFKDGSSKRVSKLIGTRAMLIALDGKENIYFTNSSGLFKNEKNSDDVLNLGKYVINGLNSDVNGKLYFTSPNGIFSINEKQNTVEQLVTMDNVYAAAIERDGSILCGTEDSIIRFKKNDKCNK